MEEYIEQFYNYVKIYTDASKNQVGQTGIGVIIPEFKLHIGRK